MNPSDPRWIGNWWVGILGASGLSFVFSIFIMGFPRNIPCQRDIRENNLESANVKEKKAQELNFKNIQNKLSELPKILKDLLTNWTFVFNCMAINCVLMYSNGLSPFYAKVIMLHYGVEPEKIGNAMALAAVLPVIGMPIIFYLLAFLLAHFFILSAFCSFLFFFVPPLVYFVLSEVDSSLQPYLFALRSGLPTSLLVWLIISWPTCLLVCFLFCYLVCFVD